MMSRALRRNREPRVGQREEGDRLAWRTFDVRLGWPGSVGAQSPHPFAPRDGLFIRDVRGSPQMIWHTGSSGLVCRELPPLAVSCGL